MLRKSTLLALIAVLGLAIAPAARAVDGDLIAVKVEFEQVLGVWKVVAYYEESQATSSPWNWTYTIQQFRSGNLIGTVDTGGSTIGAADVSTCSIFCAGTCWNGNKRGRCEGTNPPCSCNVDGRIFADAGASAQAGDVYVFTMSTTATESSSTNNTAQGTF